MKRILLSTLVACVLSTDTFAYQAQISGGRFGTSQNRYNTTSYSGTEDDRRMSRYATKNAHIEIKSGNIEHNYRNIYGAYSRNDMILNNSITMSGGSANNLYGGYSDKDEANNNTITISGGSANNLYGGYSSENEANNNTITMSGGSANNLYGGYSSENETNSNTITMSGGSADYLYGGYSFSGAVNNNSVTISSGKVNRLYGGYSINEDVLDNSVIMSGGSANVLYGGDSSKSAFNNSIIMSGGSAGDLYGGCSSERAANNNSIIISGGSANNLYGGQSNKSRANYNSVIIYGNAIINGNVYGGYAILGTATDNTVTYSGGMIKGDIYGGYGKTSANNKLIISGTNLSANSVIGNTFQEYLFSLPTSIKANDTMLKLTKPLTFNDSDKLEMNAQGKLDKLKLGDKITLVNNVANNYQGKYYTLAKYKSGVADYYYGFDLSISNKQLQATLINNGDLKLSGTSGDWEDWGLTLDEIREFLLALDGIEDVGNAIEVVASQEAKSLSEGSSASMATLNSASDTIAGKATENAMENAGNSSLGGNSSMGSFGAIGGGANRYKTGSYVDSKSINLVAGIALGKELNYGKLVVGPFIEFGYSDYETHNDFSSGHVKGDGDSKYYGIGALTRFDFNDFKGSRPYIEFSARFGRNNNDFNNDLGASYDVSSNYYGLHAGLGYIFKNNSNIFDIYAKYFFTHLNGTDTTLATGENFAFDAVKSHKTRLGIKYSKEIELASGNIIAPYIGAGWEKEYSGDAKATTTPAGSNIGFAVTAPSLKGNSAMAEVGLNLGKEKGFKADIGLTGYAGIHRGVNANLILQYEF